MDETLKKRGGDTRIAAARNNKKVGPPTKAEDGSRFERQVKLLLDSGDDDTLAAFARVDGVTKQDLIRAAVRRYLIERQIV